MNKHHIACCIFIIACAGFFTNYLIAAGVDKRGIESIATIEKFGYDCKVGHPTQKNDPRLNVSYVIAGKLRNYSASWWADGEHAYCNLLLGSKIQLKTILINIGTQEFIFTYGNYEIKKSKSDLYVSIGCFFLAIFFCAIGITEQIEQRSNN